MNQTVKKMFVAGVALIVSVVLIVTVTYAWTVLSSAPVAEGVQISIGGGNTILLAPDVSKTVDGEVCHYPGNFNDNLVFSRFQSYDYLKQVCSLSPVSTADGLNWFTPSYYDITDQEVKLGQASVGDVKSIQTFKRDDMLLNANLQNEDVTNGHYIYLDFWVVSPGADYTVRISCGDQDSGSYLLDLPKVRESDEGFYLDSTNDSFASSARVGFLVNTNTSSNKDMTAYQSSRDYNPDYKTILGAYQEKGQQIYPGQYRFTIYEPNGNLHSNAGNNSSYVETRPVGLVDEKASLVDVSDKLTVQLKNSWVQKSSDNISLDEMLTVATVGKDIKTAKEAEATLYDSYLQGQFSPYVVRGRFISNTRSLYKMLNNGRVDATELASLETAGATEDQFIVKLTKNVPQRIRMYVWLEGQDADCSRISESGRFALSIELAGSNKE